MIVRDCMKHRVYSVHPDATIAAAAALMSHHRIGTLPVIDQEHRLVGMLRLENLLALVMPDFVKLVEHFEFAHTFGPLEHKKPDPEMLQQSVAKIMEEPISITEDSGVLRAAAMLHFRDLRDLPIVDANDRLVGLVSHVDLGVAVMSGWNLPDPALQSKS